MEGLRLVEVRQSTAPAVADVSRSVREEVRKLLRQRSLPRRSRVGITAGSRGVIDAVEIYRASVETLIEEGRGARQTKGVTAWRRRSRRSSTS